jgi:hypothetical protein
MLFIDGKYIFTDDNNLYESKHCKLNKTNDIPLFIWNGKKRIKVSNVSFIEIKSVFFTAKI